MQILVCTESVFCMIDEGKCRMSLELSSLASARRRVGAPPHSSGIRQPQLPYLRYTVPYLSLIVGKVLVKSLCTPYGVTYQVSYQYLAVLRTPAIIPYLR